MTRSHIVSSLLAAFLLSLSFAGCTKLPDDMELVQLSEVESIEPGKQSEREIKGIELWEALESDPHHHISTRGDYLMLFRKHQKNKNDVYNLYFEQLERSLIASEDAAIRKAENSRAQRADQRTTVVRLIRMESDQENFTKAGDFVWQVRFGNEITNKEVFVSSTTGKCISLFGNKEL